MLYLIIIELLIISSTITLAVYATAALAKKRRAVSAEVLRKMEKQVAEQQKEQLAAYAEERVTAENELAQLHNKIKVTRAEAVIQTEHTQQIINQLKQRKADASAATDEFIATQSAYATERIHANIYKELAAYRLDLMRMQIELQTEVQQELNEAFAAGQQELSTLQMQIEDFRAKQAIINEEILRRRQMEEQQDFYRVCLTETAINDIEVLNSIRSKLYSHDLFDKLIYDTYIAKPVQEMVKRVLKGGTPSGIYKITRLKTGEVYVGKSTDVRARWQQHLKTAFGVGTIAHSILHTTMEKDGVQNFTFELLEEVPKDKLTEREKYWINFYDSKSYGLNMREG